MQSFLARSARLPLTTHHFSRVGVSHRRTYAATTRTYPARPAATRSRVAKAPASTTTTQVSQDDISEAIADAEGVREPVGDETVPENELAVEPASSRLSHIAFPGDFVSGGDSGANDWSKSYYGLSVEAFPKDIADILLAPLDELDIEMKPGASLLLTRRTFLTSLTEDGLIYLPEIKYRRILNKAFGPGAWGLAPRTETNVGPKIVSREYALVCQGR